MQSFSRWTWPCGLLRSKKERRRAPLTARCSHPRGGIRGFLGLLGVGAQPLRKKAPLEQGVVLVVPSGFLSARSSKATVFPCETSVRTPPDVTAAELRN